VVGAAVTALILWTPILVAGYRSPPAHLALDTVDACAALLLAYLVFGRFARRRRISDLILANGLLLLAVPGLGLTFAAEALSGPLPGTLDTWVPLTIRVIGALLVAAAAVAHLGRSNGARQGVPSLGVPLAVSSAVVVVCLALWSARLHLPVALAPGYVPSSAEYAIGTWHPLLPLAQGVAAVCFFVASIAFTVRADKGDALVRWLGPACALGGFARLNYMLFPSLYSDWLYTGDLLRAGCYALLLVGAAGEMRQYWNAQSRAAVLDDRRRLARELHDGVIQELAYIRMESRALGHSSDDAAERIIAACDRALDETRAAVHALGHTGDEPLGFMLHRTARELAERYAVSLEVDLDDSITASQDQRHALMRITREAVSNAVRHGGARKVSVRLGTEGGGRQLTIQDDGHGFDVDAAPNGGYGLISMRERARALPGTFAIDAGVGRGSRVMVTW
jgi:signal transduction histidine kinase